MGWKGMDETWNGRDSLYSIWCNSFAEPWVVLLQKKNLLPKREQILSCKSATQNQ